MSQEIFKVSLKELKLLSLTIALVFCGSIGLDIHLASFPEMMHYMHTTKAAMQHSVTLYILGVALSMLVYGPLSDKVGRRPIILFGLGFASISSFLACFTDHIGVFLLLRFLQGVGCGVCWGMGRIIAADIMQDERLAAVGSYLTLFLSLSTLFAPALGGYIQHWFGWQANFMVIGIVTLCVQILLYLFFEETNEHKDAQAFELKNLVGNYLYFFRNKAFVGATLLTGIAMSANIVFITMSSFMFQQEFHKGPIVFGWLMAAIGVAEVMSKLILPIFIYYLKNSGSLILGIVSLVLSGVVLSVFSLFGIVNSSIVLIAASIAMFAVVVVGSVTMAMSLSPFPNKRGSAGALFGSFQLLISVFFSDFVSRYPDSGSAALSVSYLVLGGLAVLSYYLFIRSPLMSAEAM